MLVTRKHIDCALADLGVQKGAILEVHTSLSSFGSVEGGAQTLLDALMDAVGEQGSLFMPALRLSPALPLTDADRQMGILSKIHILPPDAPRTAMGIVADTFRKRPDVVTSDGVFRTAAWGAQKQRVLTEGLNPVIQDGGYAILMGVDIYRLTAMHYMEDVLPDSVKAIFAPNAAAKAAYSEEEWLVETGEPPVKPWYTIQNIAYARGLIRDYMVGDSRWMFFKVADVVSIYREELLNRAEELYGLK